MNEPLLTRQQAPHFIREMLGIPVTPSRIDKAAMNGTGPRPAAKYGRRDLYTPAELLRWARTLIRPTEMSRDDEVAA